MDSSPNFYLEKMSADLSKNKEFFGWIQERSLQESNISKKELEENYRFNKSIFRKNFKSTRKSSLNRVKGFAACPSENDSGVWFQIFQMKKENREQPGPIKLYLNELMRDRKLETPAYGHQEAQPGFIKEDNIQNRPKLEGISNPTDFPSPTNQASTLEETQNLLARRNILTSTYLTKCHFLCKLCEKKELPLGYSNMELNYEDLLSVPPRSLIQLSKKSQNDSKRVQAMLESSDLRDPFFKAFLDELYRSLPSLVNDQYGCYIPGALLKLDSAYAQYCEAYCVKNLSKLCTNKCAVKVMQALAGSSTNFSMTYLDHFRMNYDRLVYNKESMILLNKVILHIPDQHLLKFIIKDVEYNFSLREMERPQLLRILSSLFEVCQGKYLEQLFAILKPHIWWLVDDKFGNFAVMTMIKTKPPNVDFSVNEIILADPVLMFTNKYRRVLLLNCLSSIAGFENFVAELIRKLVLHPRSLRKLIEQETGCCILLAALSVVGDPNLLRKMRRRVFKEMRLVLNGKQFPHLGEFLDGLEDLFDTVVMENPACFSENLSLRDE